MAKVVSLFNQSGGVGKSTLTMNLGYQLGQLQQRVLLVDMDPQASLTAFMGLEPSELSETIYQAILADADLAIHTDIHGMHLVPANIDLSGAELELVLADMRDLRLRQALESALDDFDFILIDCPPSLGLLSYISLVASTHVLVPIQTQYKALKGTELLLKTVKRVRSRANPDLKFAGIVPTMYDTRTVQDQMSLAAIKSQLAQVAPILPCISRSVAFADASQEHLPLALYNPKHPAVAALQEIAQAMEQCP
jgi:chromosome partitioning protein